MAIVPFKQIIKPGDKGLDVYAVHRALVSQRFRKVAPRGYVAGPAFVAALKLVQENGKLTVDGIYGPATHQIVSKWFDLFGRALYKRAAIREPMALRQAREMLAYARTFDGPYEFGGGHGLALSNLSVHQGLDCSSSTSLALRHIGLMPSSVAEVSGWFESYGDYGSGKYITIHANADHVWVEFTLPEGWYRFDTSPHGDGANGPRVRTRRRPDNHFDHRHPRGY